MPRPNRYTNTAAVVSAPQNISNGYGGLTRAGGSTVVSDYKFSHWFPSAFQRTKLIEQYALTDNAILKRISGAYNSAIKAGMFITIDSDTYKLIGVNPTQGRGRTYTSLAIVAIKIQGTA